MHVQIHTRTSVRLTSTGMHAQSRYRYAQTSVWDGNGHEGGGRYVTLDGRGGHRFTERCRSFGRVRRVQVCKNIGLVGRGHGYAQRLQGWGAQACRTLDEWGGG